MDNHWPLRKCILILGRHRIMRENAYFVLLMKAQVARERINLHKIFFMAYDRASAGISLQYSFLLKSKGL